MPGSLPSALAFTMPRPTARAAPTSESHHVSLLPSALLAALASLAQLKPSVLWPSRLLTRSPGAA